MVVIGPEVMLDSYFNNSGIKNMAEKLCELDPDFDNALFLFHLIEINFNLDKNVHSSILSQIEIRILKYFKIKIKNDILNGINKDDILKSIEEYKRFLVTNVVINARGESMAKYEDIEGVLKEFNKFENEVKEKFVSRNI